MEIWKPIRNFPSYNASSEGRIMNVRTQYILKPYIDHKGRATVCVRKNNRKYSVRVHKLIAETFLGEHPGMNVIHKDRNILNNCVDNLEWCTNLETLENMRTTRRTPIRVSETGETYISIAECARSTGCCRSDIFKQLAGRLPHVKGLHFERIHSY